MLVGAGVSAEVGLPTWKQLAEQLISRVPQDGGDMDEARRLYEARKYAEVAGWIARNYGHDFLYQNCRELLEDDATRFGRVADFIARFPFKSVFTTNFDDVLSRHFARVKKARKVFVNSKRDLAQVDVNTLPCIVKLHSDFRNTDTIVLTDEQFWAAANQGEFQYLRQFIQGHLLTMRFVVLGYSITDPDICLVLEQLGQNMRREIPIYAVLADVAPEEAAVLRLRFNVEVVPYRNLSGTHRELVRMFEAMTPFVTETPSRGTSLGLELERAQSLYLWSKLGLKPGADAARVDALKAVVLDKLRAGPTTAAQVLAQVSAVVGIGGHVLAEAVEDALFELRERQFIVQTHEGLVALSEAAAKTAQQSADQHDALRTQFIDQTRIDLETEWGDVTEDVRRRACNLACDALVDVFDQRGVELVNATFQGTSISSRGSAQLFALLAKRGRELGDVELAHRFVRYMAGLLSNPGEAQRSYLDHLALAFFSLHALAMDPKGQRFRDDFLADRALVVDSNVLIPLFPLGGRFRRDAEAVLSLVTQHELRLVTTPGFIDEVFRHGTWARQHVEQFGMNSIAVMQAARGEGYKQNQFLDGWIRYSVDERSLSFDEYLRTCVAGKEFGPSSICEILTSQYGIAVVGLEAVAPEETKALSERQETEEFIKHEAEEAFIEKNDSRMKAEAEAYEVVRNWPGKLERVGVPQNLAVLSQGGYLNRLAFRGPRPLQRYIVVAPAALYAFLLKTGVAPKEALSFRELMVSSLFDTSAHFVDRARYRVFFANLINKAERIFREHLDDFRREVDENLRSESFDDIDPLDMPFFVESLERQLGSRADQAQRDMERAQARVAVLGDAARIKERELAATEKRIRGAKGALRRKVGKVERRGKRRR